MTSDGSIAGRAGLCASALVLGGCMSTVTVPASELPLLGTPTVHASSEWPTVRAFEGESIRIVGPVQRIELQSAQGIVPLYPPFAARTNGLYLEVSGPSGMRAFSLDSNPTITIEYENLKRKRTITGIALIGAGVPFLIGGGVLVASGVASSNDGLEGKYERFGFLMLGIPFAAAGLSLAIPGIVLVATDPKKRDYDQTGVQAILQLRPGGAGLMVPF
jgi:hypothetical protein